MEMTDLLFDFIYISVKVVVFSECKVWCKVFIKTHVLL